MAPLSPTLGTQGRGGVCVRGQGGPARLAIVPRAPPTPGGGVLPVAVKKKPNPPGPRGAKILEKGHKKTRGGRGVPRLRPRWHLGTEGTVLRGDTQPHPPPHTARATAPVPPTPSATVPFPGTAPSVAQYPPTVAQHTPDIPAPTPCPSTMSQYPPQCPSTCTQCQSMALQYPPQYPPSAPVHAPSAPVAPSAVPQYTLQYPSTSPVPQYPQCPSTVPQ